MLADHSFLRLPVYFYCLFSCAQLLSGAVLFYKKIGFESPAVLEYYQGSENMRKIYPDEPDRFIQPKTLSGMIKVQLGHFLFFAFNGFFLVHIIRSLMPGAALPEWMKRPRVIDFATWVYFTGALFDIASGFLVRYGPGLFAGFRILAFFWFVLSGFLLAVFLLYVLWKS